MFRVALKALIAIVLMMAFCSLSGTYFYIDCNASGPNFNGTINDPFNTIQQAINAFNVQGHPHLPDGIVTFLITPGSYNENLNLTASLFALDINTWGFKANNGIVTIAGNTEAQVINPILVGISELIGASVVFEGIQFRPDTRDISVGFLTTAPCLYGDLAFIDCDFFNLQNGILITEQETEPDVMYIGKLVVQGCTFNNIRREGRGIYTYARNLELPQDAQKFINKIHIHDNLFRTDGIVNPEPNYNLSNIRITNYRKYAPAYDSVFVYDNIFINEMSNVKPTAMFFDGLNRQRQFMETDNKCKAFAYENKLTNNLVYAEISDLKYSHNNAYNPDNDSAFFITFKSDPEVGIDTLWAEWNYSKSNNIYVLENAVLIDAQNSHLGEGTFIKASVSSARFINSLTTGFESIFDLEESYTHSQYCYYDFLVESDIVSYGDGIVTEDPLIECDPSGFGYSFIWSENEKSPCIMAGFDEGFNQLNPIPNGTTSYDKLDIGAIQYNENPNEWITYSFPTGIQRNGNRWLCFPTADRLLDNPFDLDMAYTFFENLMTQSYVDSIFWKPTDYDGNGDVNYKIIYFRNYWVGDNHLVTPQQGYKMIMSQYLYNNISITTEGIYPKISDAPIHLRALKSDGEPNENWIGYYGKKTLSPFDAFRNVINNLYMIKTQNWCMVRRSNPGKSQADWIYIWDNNNPHTLSYGDMAVVKCYADGDFHWPSNGTELQPYELEEIEHFTFVEKPDYKPFYINFEGTNLPKEVGLYIDNICMGAAKVIQDSVEVKAYLYEGLPEYPNIEFRLYYETKTNDLITNYSALDMKTGEFKLNKLSLNNKQDYYMVKINTGDNDSSPIPKMYIANYPNPFNPNTMIEYYLPKDSEVSIDIFNVKGQKVNSLATGFREKGVHQINWNGRDSKGKLLGSGVYFATYSFQGNQITKKMLMLK